MPRISELRASVRDAVGRELAGFVCETGGASFVRQAPDALQMVHVSFLDRSHAARFNTTTASFSLELGVFFPFIPRVSGATTPVDEPPPIFECQVRGLVRRNVRQVAPVSGYSTPAHQRRRDIWWLDATGGDLALVVDGVRNALRQKALSWLARFSKPRYVARYLRWVPAGWPGSPFNLGRRGCPFRRQLISAIEDHLSWSDPGELASGPDTLG